MDDFWDNIQFSENSIVVNLQATAKEAAVLELLTNLADRRLLQVSSSFFLKKMMERESKGSTGMQNGIAFPHLRTDETEVFLVVLGISRMGVEFQSLDGKPTNIIMLSIVPEDMVEMQLQYLSKMSVLLSSEKIRQKIISSESPGQIYSLLCNAI